MIYIPLLNAVKVIAGWPTEFFKVRNRKPNKQPNKQTQLKKKVQNKKNRICKKQPVEFSSRADFKVLNSHGVSREERSKPCLSVYEALALVYLRNKQKGKPFAEEIPQRGATTKKSLSLAQRMLW